MNYRTGRQKLWDTVPSENWSGLKIYRASEIPDSPAPENGDGWGDWRLKTADPPSLDYVGGFYKSFPYEIELTRISRGGFMEWIEHLHGKTWGSESMGDFVDAVLTISRYGYVDRKTHVTVYPGRRSPKDVK